ncbi:hypothetical protein J6590_034076 [Homalodisca vitripennis]|nr:hypothetical protein J6590_034076 [Homalodisca vitripennis]
MPPVPLRFVIAAPTMSFRSPPKMAVIRSTVSGRVDGAAAGQMLVTLALSLVQIMELMDAYPTRNSVDGLSELWTALPERAQRDAARASLLAFIIQELGSRTVFQQGRPLCSSINSSLRSSKLLFIKQ